MQVCDKCAELQQQLAAAQAVEQDLRYDLGHTGARLDQAEERIAELEEQNAAHVQTIREREAEIASAHDGIAHWTAKCNEIEIQLSKQLREREEQLAAKTKECEELTECNSKLNADHDDLMHQLRNRAKGELAEQALRTNAEFKAAKLEEQLAKMREATMQLIMAIETCHQCKAVLLVSDEPAHCQDCSSDCENHDGPNCEPLSSFISKAARQANR